MTLLSSVLRLYFFANAIITPKSAAASTGSRIPSKTLTTSFMNCRYAFVWKAFFSFSFSFSSSFSFSDSFKNFL